MKKLKKGTPSFYANVPELRLFACGDPAVRLRYRVRWAHGSAGL